jgi:hypothetical protein
MSVIDKTILFVKQKLENAEAGTTGFTSKGFLKMPY